MRKRLLAAAAGALLALGALPAAAQDEGYGNPHLLMTADELAAALAPHTTDGALDIEAAGMVVIDVRPAEDFAAGHIPGALQVEPDAVADPDSPVAGDLRQVEELTAMLKALAVTPDRQVVFYDDRGGFHAARMFWLAEYLGHRNVSLLNGGVQAWEAAGQSLAEGPAAAAPEGSFSPALTPRRIAFADWILEREGEPETVVVDVRPVEMYAEGHIPWAKSVPWSANLNEDNTMKSAADLRAHFADAGVMPEHDIVVHCQQGLASSHSYVALRLLGYPRVRTYHRSWAEWGEADDLPKASASQG